MPDGIKVENKWLSIFQPVPFESLRRLVEYANPCPKPPNLAINLPCNVALSNGSFFDNQPGPLHRCHRGRRGVCSILVFDSGRGFSPSLLSHRMSISFCL
jgi:hypothetical protein